MRSAHVVWQVAGLRQDLDCDSRNRVAVESRGLLDKLEWGQVSRLAMIAVSQLNSGSERRSSDSHILDAALSSVLWIMYHAVAWQWQWSVSCCSG